MSLIPLCLLALAVPQGGDRPKIVLPPPPAEQEAAAEPKVQASELERFHRDALRLRRSLRLSRSNEDLVLTRIGSRYEHPDDLALQLARRADADLMHGLLLVLARYGDPEDAEELMFLLLTRPFASATRAAVTTMAELARDGAKDALMSCLTARYAGVRKAATDLLLARIDKTDLPRVLELSRDDKTDIQRKALFLLGALPYPEARARLLQALSSSSPLIAATACRSLISHGPDVAGDLQAIVGRPPLDRSFGYAAFALSELEDRTGREFLTEDMVDYLRQELTGTDNFMRTASALALANLAFRSDDAKGFAYGDREIVDGLMLVVAPRAFVTSFDMLHTAAASKIVRFTGRDLRGRAHAWRKWWKEARDGFVGMRLRVDVTAENGDRAVLTWRDATRAIRFRGERTAPDPAAEGTLEFMLSGPEMASLVHRLEAQGFMRRGLVAAASSAEMLPAVRAIELRRGRLRTRVRGPARPAEWLDALESEVLAVAARERWQLYPAPGGEDDRRAFWQEERKWLAEHEDPRARDRRLKDRIIAALPGLSGARRALAFEHLLAIADLGALLTERDGLALAERVVAADELDDDTFRMLEIALLAPGEKVWRAVLDAVDSHYDTGGRRRLGRVFSLLGPDRVLRAFSDGRRRVRVAAMLEIANLRDVRAAPELMEVAREEDEELRRTAVYALGVLQSADAREELLALAADPDTEPATRRVAWVALGRIGGEGVLPVLQAAAASPELRDQLSAIQALGELAEPRAAAFLAQILASHGLNPRGTQAMASLQKQGALLARPALRRFLTIRDPRIRREIVMLLGEFQDPAVVPDLISLLDDGVHGTRAALLLSGITGVDLTEVNERARYMREWWQQSKDLPQAMWFVQALRRNRIDTDLAVDQLAPGAGVEAVPALTGVMLKAREPHLRVLAAALLRDITEKEFGSVSMQSTVAQLQAIADRYRFFADSEKAAKDR